MEGSILEKFVILFTSNSKEVEEGTTKAKNSTKKLGDELASVEGAAKKAGEHVTDFFKEAVGAFLAFMTVRSIVDHIRETSEFADKIGKLSEELDVNVEQLSAWGDAVALNGGSSEEFQGTVKRMTAALSDFATKGHSRAAPFFQALGIKMVDAHHKARSFLDILPELADSFSKISKQESLGIGEKMGLDEGTILTLQKGRREVEALIAEQKELGVITEKQAQVSKDYNDQLEKTKHAFRSLYAEVGLDLLPILSRLSKMFEEVAVYFRKHSHLIEGGIIAISAAIARYLIPALVEAVISFSPFLLIGVEIAAIVGLFALLYDDIKNFEEGNNSVIGTALKKWPQLGAVLKGINNIIRQIKESFELFGYTSVQMIEWIIRTIKNAFHGVEAFIDKVEHFYNKAKGFIGGNHSADINSSLEIGQRQIAIAAASPFAAQTTTSIVNGMSTANKSNNIQIDSININAQSANPDEIYKTVGKNLHTQIQQAMGRFDDGVAA